MPPIIAEPVLEITDPALSVKISSWYLLAFLGAVFVITTVWLVRKGTQTTRVAVVIFICGPVLFLGLFLASLTDLAAMVLRLVLLISATFVPAMLYFLFISARRESLFNAFATYLERLGLLRRWWIAGPDEATPRRTALILESPLRRRRRVKSYLDRFGAVYGGLSEKFTSDFLTSIETDDDKALRKLSADAAAFDFPTVLPVLGATCLLSLGWLGTLPPGVFEPYQGSNFSAWFKGIMTPTSHPVTFAFLGAYFYSLQMVIKRFVRRDLGANAYNAISLRVLLAVIAVWVATSAFKTFDPAFQESSPYAMVAAFAIGAFPLIVWQLITGSLKKFPLFQFALPSLTASQPLDAIDGMTIWHQARFEEEDIENIPNLATADIVDLILSTKIPPHRMIDWIDQAILLTYLGKGEEQVRCRAILQKYGIRTATSLEAACRATVEAGHGTALPPFNGEDGRRFRAMVGPMYDCPNFILARNWRGIADAHLSASALLERPIPPRPRVERNIERVAPDASANRSEGSQPILVPDSRPDEVSEDDRAGAAETAVSAVTPDGNPPSAR